jgi:hypothetical protein
MTNYGAFSLLIALALLLSGCRDSEAHIWKYRQDYTICFSNRQETEEFRNYITSVAKKTNMEIYDWSAQEEEALAKMEHAQGALKDTALPLIFVTFEKKDRLHVTLGNLSLKDDLGITFSYDTEQPPTEISDITKHFKQEYRYVTLDKNGPGSLPCKD